MSKHTPAPWTMRELRGSGYPGQVGWAIDYNEDQEQVVDYVYEEADARLISAAPELLEALTELVTDMVIAQGNMRDAAKHDPRWEGCADAIQPRIDAARAAIAKARGN